MSSIYLNQGVSEPLSRVLDGLSETVNVAVIRGGQSYPKRLMTDALNRSRSVLKLKEFSGFSVNPKFEEIYSGLEELWEFKPQLVIGIGGGSILDTAKILRFFALSRVSKSDLERELKSGTSLETASFSTALLLMPTTAGSGAESTAFSVVYFGATKYSFQHSGLLPEFVIADSQLVSRAPPQVLGSSAMDAIAQSIESIWARGGNNESRDKARKALRLMWNSARSAIVDKRQEAIENIILGSHLAGQAINVSKTTGNHALSYKITTDHDVPHGHCVGMLLPQFFKLHRRISNRDEVRARSAIEAQQSIAAGLGYDSFAEFEAEYLRLLDALGLENFETLNQRYSFDSAAIAASVNIQRLKNHPIDLSREELESVFD